MENIKQISLEKKLRNKLSDVSYKHGSDKSNLYIVFLDSLYKEALNTPVKFEIIDSSKQNNLEVQPFETWTGLNGDKLYIYWVENKGIDNIDVFIKVD